MAQSGGSAHSTDRSLKVASGPRRFWTHFEEEALINALEALCAEGWCSDGIFKGGYIMRLENMITEKLPRGGIIGKHIKSKLQVWKKAYSLAFGLLGSSGNGDKARIDPTTHTIVVDSDKVWVEYIKKRHDAVKIRGKPLPWYHKWVNIFGNDGTNKGEGSIDIGDAVHMLSRAQRQHVIAQPQPQPQRHLIEHQVPVENLPNTQIPGNGNIDDYNQVNVENLPNTPIAGNGNIDDDTNTSITPPSISASEKNGTCSPKRCKRSLEDLMGSWMDDTYSVLRIIVDKLKQPLPPPVATEAQPDSNSSLRRSLFDALAEISGLSLDDQIVATHRLAHNEIEMDMFWGMHKEARSRYVRLLLSGKLKP